MKVDFRKLLLKGQQVSPEILVSLDFLLVNKNGGTYYGI